MIAWQKRLNRRFRLRAETLEPRRMLTNCIDFEGLPLGQEYFVGDSFTADNVGFQANVRGASFEWSDGTIFAGGVARVENGLQAGGAGQEIAVNNILLDFAFVGGPVNGLRMNFGEFGGNLNLEVNGDFRNFQDFQDINGALIGGTMVTVPVGGFGNDKGLLEIDGAVMSFKVGGQELWIDSVCRGQGEDLDWGDAPDRANGPFYRTLAMNNGAVHQIDNVHFLGDRVDAEFDGQPNATATGDDLAGPALDDEDGVFFLTPLVPGQMAEVEVLAAEDGFLTAWVDFDGSGTWNASDQIFAAEPLIIGSNVLNFMVPNNADVGRTFSRWRVTDQNIALEPFGTGTSGGRLLAGEVEDHLVHIDRNLDCIDFESLPLGQQYFVGDVFTADPVGFKAEIRGEPFTFSGGGTTSMGFARVENGGLAGDAGQELQVNNILLGFDFGGPIPGLNMNFGEYGGNLNLEINGDFRNFQDFQDVNGLVIGGTVVTVPFGGFGNDTGVLMVSGTVNSFKVGGQELWIDHLCLKEGDRLDWGDAPDQPGGPSYRTLSASFGAVHRLNGVHFLGETVDPEPDGQPNLLATGDDLAGPAVDDEDGITFLTPLVPGQMADVEVIASEDGFLSAWVDFDRNGVWNPSDQIFATQFVLIGTHVLTFMVPNTAETGPSMSRWRFTDEQIQLEPFGPGLPSGEVVSGEVEDHRVVIDDLDCIDFEDLPLGQQYFVGDSFVADNFGFQAVVRGQPFTFSGGGMTNMGFAQVDNDQAAGHVGQDMEVNNILLDFNFISPAGPLTGLNLNFGEFGGNLNLEINGDFRNFEDFQDINGLFIGGALVTVPVGGFGNDQGRLVVDGLINSFKVGGQELWIDHICRKEGDRLDWGDAPDSAVVPRYPTLAVNDGAFHRIDGVHFLGEEIDAEPDGQPTADARGDDLAGPAMDDEDGVVFVSPIVAGQPAIVEVTANADGFLTAWMDFDSSGSWDPGVERIFSVEFLLAGTTTLTFNVPSDALPGRTFSRWRFTDQQVPLRPTGAGNPNFDILDGEVEDYVHTIEPDECDFNGDGLCDCDDIDALVAEVVSGTNNPLFDLNGDSLVNFADVGVWLADAAAHNGLPNPYLPGDANLDGDVDVPDFNVWNMNKFTATAAWCKGDFNADGNTDVSDFNIWNMNKFMSSFPAPPAVGVARFGNDALKAEAFAAEFRHESTAEFVDPVASRVDFPAQLAGRRLAIDAPSRSVRELPDRDVATVRWTHDVDEMFSRLA